jgi:hypothetical protein
MKLVEFIENLESVDEDLIIFQENKEDYNSDIILAFGEEGDDGIKIENGKKYNYLIEVFLAKEFVEDWLGSLDYLPNKNEIAKRLFEYAINDA